MNKISIVIPIYNVEQYLAQCLDSIINQTYQNIEIILVNDGSTDNCPQICEDYAAKDNRIKVIHKENGGLSDARNAGYQLVTGDYLAFVDSDDLVFLDFYGELLKIAIQKNADIVESGILKFTDEKDLQNLQQDNRVKEFETEKALELLMKEQLKQVVWNKLYKTNIVNNLLFEKGKIHEDEFWTYQIFARAKKIVKTNYPLYFYRQQEESIMAEKYSIRRLSGLEAREQRVEFMQKNFPNLTNLAIRTFWHSAFNNYQAIVRNPSVDVEFIYRKNILEKIRNNVKPKHYADWKTKDVLWLKCFLAAPEWCSKLRNFAGIGV